MEERRDASTVADRGREALVGAPARLILGNRPRAARDGMAGDAGTSAVIEVTATHWTVSVGAGIERCGILRLAHNRYRRD
jgi:hypothetical protein